MTRARRPVDCTLYATDGEIAGVLGVTASAWAAAAAVLEKDGLPRPDPLFGGRRYWPAVRAYLDRRAGMGQPSTVPVADGEETWNERSDGRRARARA